MLNTGPAKKVTIYLGEDLQYHHTAAYAAILDFLFYRGVLGATVTRGIAGFGADHRMHTARLERLAENLPMRIEFIDTQQKLDDLLPKLQEMAGNGLIEIHDTTVLLPETPPREAAPAPPLRVEGTAKLMRIYFGENDKWAGKPLHEALVRALRANDIAGVTVYRGICGYGANRRIHRDKTLSLSHDRPIMLSVVDSEDKLRGFVPILEQMVQQGLVVMSDVDIVKYAPGAPAHDSGERAEEGAREA